jgi:predicted small secreted protein
MRSLLALIFSSFVVSSTLILTGCNTVQGVGEDFKAAGQVIKETSEDVKRKIRE